MQDNFYRAFEDKHRGSREVIKERLTVYLPFIEPFKNIYSTEELKVLDLGCGRGEWIELVSENAFIGLGVDIDDGMLQACKILNLNVIHSDALEFLQKSQDESFVAVSGFHIAEHLPFDMLQNLVKEALRVLKPGGLLILETPNPENIMVATTNFWLDPTHIRPLPPLLLLFLTEYYGFAKSKILRLQEDKNIRNPEFASLLQVLYSSSPDYAIIAQKHANSEITALFDEVFSKEYGVTLENLSEKFQNRILNIENKSIESENRITEAESKIVEAFTLLEKFQNRILNIENKSIESENRITEAESKIVEAFTLLEKFQNRILNIENKSIESENRITEAESKIVEAFTLYNSLLNSKPWKITYPLRLLGRFARWFKTGAIAWITFTPESRPRLVTRKTITKTKEYLNKKPKLKSFVKLCLKPFPGLQDRPKKAEDVNNGASFYDENLTEIENPDLGPTARKIYNDLKNAIEEEKNKCA
ncbi:hypothetical protein DESAMIL20_1956 [Desulfurella amilsii]|uniref:Methyltransferase type 11 domain-containing protein n=1 Tax=Desulfurella amilsii TaxID=1562698 RepID=A0A1X4XY03_9BACT|nr:methyltransferase domain-containing protein [Desulfurella amilsii]OSS42403.1 hypothetical protein DESAMIL20_1956 [Desulfurella amilsii]